MELYGRTVIYTSVDEIDESNVRQVLDDALTIHEKNISEIDYLYDYYKGKSEIENRTKEVRDDILNKICENRAKEIVDFKVPYVVGSPIIYSTPNEDNSEIIERLNRLNKMEGKATKDYEMVEWMMIAGTAYRAILPKEEKDDCPYTIDIPDPRQAFVIYSSGIHRQQMASGYMVTDQEGITWYWIYTRNKMFKLNDADEHIESLDWTLDYFPIIEYPANSARLGAFECVIDLIDAINELDSNRQDAIMQFIQSLLVLINCKLPEGYTATSVAQNGLIELVSNADNPAKLELLSQQLDQTQTQTLKNDFYNAILTICAMPNRNGGSSTSDTGIAVMYRDGWSAAETARKATQQMIERSEYESLRLMLKICEETGTLNLPVYDINIDFTQDHYENLEMKTAVLIQLLSNDKVHPLTAYEVCGLFADPNARYLKGMEWFNGRTEESIPTEV